MLRPMRQRCRRCSRDSRLSLSPIVVVLMMDVDVDVGMVSAVGQEDERVHTK